MRRSLKKQQISNNQKRLALRSKRRQKVIDGRRTLRPQKESTIFDLHASLQSTGRIGKNPRLSDLDTKIRSLDLMHAAGISVSNSTKFNKKTFSLVKDQTSPRMVKNPVILDLEAYKNIVRTPLKASSIFKNQQDPIFDETTKISRAKFNKQKSKVTNPQPDLTRLVLASVERYKGPTAPKTVIRGWSRQSKQENQPLDQG